jgi:hypothetical protein
MLDATSLRFATPKRYKGYIVTTDCELDVERSALSVWLFCPLFQLLRLSAFQFFKNATTLPRSSSFGDNSAALEFGRSLN